MEMKWVYCTKHKNGKLIKKWKIPLFYYKIKWFYRLYIKGWKKYYKKENGEKKR